jgi:hypothetical protein
LTINPSMIKPIIHQRSPRNLHESAMIAEGARECKVEL